MTTSEPTTGEIVRALRYCTDENSICGTACPAYLSEAGCRTTVIKNAADRLESQERDLKTLRAFHERYAEQTSKQYVVAVCGLTARAEHADELDALVGGWIAARPRDVVIEEFTRAQAAIAPIYTAADIVAEEQFAAIGAIRRVEDPDLGPLLMAGGLFRSTEGDAEIAFTGRPPGADTDAVLGELGLTADELAALRTQGAVA